MTTSRRLAFDLSQMRPAQRERLLAELPADRRAHMEALVAEVAGLLREPARVFELELAREQSALPALASLNEPELRTLLLAEHPSVQRRIIAASMGNRLSEFPLAVAEVLSSYVERARESTPLGEADHAEHSRSWFRLWRRNAR